MSRKSSFSVVIVVLAIAGLSYSTLRYVAKRENHTCRACSRPVHEHSRTVALINGKRGFYCCPACALSEHQQAGKPVEVTELTDYLGSGSLNPAESFIVRNSDVNPCARHEAALSPDKQPMHTDFDRCSPSMLAFRDLKAAQAFAVEHGGQVLRFTDLASQYRR